MLFCNKKKSTWLWITIFCNIKNHKLVPLCRKIRQNLFVHTEFQKLLYIDKILIVSIYLHSSSSEECQSTGIMALRFVLLCAGLSLVLTVPNRQKRFLTDTGTRLKHFSIINIHSMKHFILHISTYYGRSFWWMCLTI